MDRPHSQRVGTESAGLPFVEQIGGLTSKGHRRHGETTRHTAGILECFKRGHRHKEYSISKAKIDLSNDEDVPIRECAIRTEGPDFDESFPNMTGTAHPDPNPLNLSHTRLPVHDHCFTQFFFDTSSDESTREEVNHDIPFIDDEYPTNETFVTLLTERVRVHDYQEIDLEDFTDSDYKSASPILRKLPQNIDEKEDEALSPVDSETRLSNAILGPLNDEFIEQMVKLSLSNDTDKDTPSMSAYLKHVGVSSEKARLFLEWLSLNDETLKAADKVCIGYIEAPDEPVYLALYSNDVPEDTCPISYNKFKIIHRTTGHISKEANVISNFEITHKIEFSEEEQKRLHACLTKNTPILMKEHSNLLMVAASKLKSEGYNTSHSKMYETICIVLYVEVKGFIPFGENPFPTEVDGISTDVREGIFKALTDPKDFHESLVMGCQIVTSYNTCGTLGAFVQLQNGYLGCLTCCHIFETPDSIIDYRKDPMSLSGFKTDVYQPLPSVEYKFGNVILFANEAGDENNIGVDAAVIVNNIPPRFPRSGDFPTINCGIAGFSPENPIVFNSGEIIQYFDDIKLPCTVVKYGATTGLTIGLLRSFGSAVQVRRPSFHPDDNVRLHQQLEVFKIEEDFAQEGDSGSLVFCVCTGGKSIELKALGLLVGGTTNGNGIVTPIWAILNKLGLPLELFCFDGLRKPITPADEKKVQVGKDQEKAQSKKRFPLQKPRWEKTKLTIRHLYHETIVSRLEM